MAPFKWDDIRVEPLYSDHNFSEFFCASEDLNDFIKNDARREQECMLSRTYLFSYEKDIVGFVSLKCRFRFSATPKKRRLGKEKRVAANHDIQIFHVFDRPSGGGRKI